MHLTRDDRITIEKNFNICIPLKLIGRNINKHCSSISREIKNHYITKNTGSVGRAFNNCAFRKTCSNRGKNCNIKNCSEFVEEKCSLLNSSPYVCNGCKKRTQCTLSKRFYEAIYAQEEYKENLKEL